MQAETTAIRRELSELKVKLSRVKDTYHEIELITQELRRQVSSPVI